MPRLYALWPDGQFYYRHHVPSRPHGQTRYMDAATKLTEREAEALAALYNLTIIDTDGFPAWPDDAQLDTYLWRDHT